MSDIRTSITLVDNFSAPVMKMAAAMREAISECEKMKSAMKGFPDMSGYSSARVQLSLLSEAHRRAARSAQELAAATGIYERGYRAYEKNISGSNALNGKMGGSEQQYPELSDVKKRMAQPSQELTDKLRLEAAAADIAAINIAKKVNIYPSVGRTYKNIGSSDRAFNRPIDRPVVISSGGSFVKSPSFVKTSASAAADIADAHKNTAKPETEKKLIYYKTIKPFDHADKAFRTDLTASGRSDPFSKSNYSAAGSDILDMSSFMRSAAELAALIRNGRSSGEASSAGKKASDSSFASDIIVKLQTALNFGSSRSQKFSDAAGASLSRVKAVPGNLSVKESQGYVSGVYGDQSPIGSDLIKNAASAADAAYSAPTYFSNYLGEKYSSFESRLKIIKNAADDLKNTLGEGLLPERLFSLDAKADVPGSILKFSGISRSISERVIGDSLKKAAAPSEHSPVRYDAVGSAYPDIENRISSAPQSRFFDNKNMPSVGMDIGENIEGAHELLEDINKISDGFFQMYLASQSADDSIRGYGNAAGDALENVSSGVISTSEKFDIMYRACEESFEKQFGLFDTAQASASSTVADAQAALNSQLGYWEQYSADLEYLKSYSSEQLGASKAEFEGFIAYLSDGTPQMAGLVNDMAEKLREGGISGEEAVGQLIDTYSRAIDERNAAAKEAADLYSDFSDTVGEAVTEIHGQVEALEGCADVSRLAGFKIVNGLRDSIISAAPLAVSAAQSLRAQVESVLAGISVSIPDVSVSGGSVSGSLRPWERPYNTGYATGTLSAAPGIALVGEEGPELIDFRGGEVVYTADETRRLMSDMQSMQSMQSVQDIRSTNVYVPHMQDTDVYIPQNVNEAVLTREPQGGTSESGGTRNIVLTIEGGKKLEIGGSSGVSKQEVCDILMSNLRPALMDVIETEIFEGASEHEY